MPTPSPPCDDALERLLAALARSLVQYIDEANPWTDAGHKQAKETLDRLAAGQRRSVAELFDLIERRHRLPELGTYPTAFTSLHYLALGFVIARLIADQLGVVAATDDAIAACGRDASRTLSRIRERESTHLADLRRLADSLRNPTEPR